MASSVRYNVTPSHEKTAGAEKSKPAALRPLHGYGVLPRITQISGDAIALPQGSLYPALYRLEHHGLFEAEW